MGEAKQAGRDVRVRSASETDVDCEMVRRDVRQRGEEGGAKLAGKDGWAKQDEWCTTGMQDRRCENGEVGWERRVGRDKHGTARKARRDRRGEG